MGVGTPLNIIENISLGIDMFDCVIQPEQETECYLHQKAQ